MLSDLPRDALVGLVKGYRLLLSPSLGSNCRFEPSCSVYAIGALQQYGAAAGLRTSQMQCEVVCLDHGRADHDSLKLGFGFQVLQSLPRCGGDNMHTACDFNSHSGVPD